MRIAVDCDSTIFKKVEFPKLGEEVPYAIGIIKRLIASGHEIYMWTCRSGESVLIMKDALDALGVKYKSINERTDQRGFSAKIDVDLFIDDKAIYCPLIPQENGRPYVDWLAIEIWLKRNGYYTIPLGEGK